MTTSPKLISAFKLAVCFREGFERLMLNDESLLETFAASLNDSDNVTGTLLRKAYEDSVTEGLAEAVLSGQRMNQVPDEAIASAVTFAEFTAKLAFRAHAENVLSVLVPEQARSAAARDLFAACNAPSLAKAFTPTGC